MKPFTLACMAFGVFGILFGCFGLLVVGLNAYSKTYQPKSRQVAPVSIPIPTLVVAQTRYFQLANVHSGMCLEAQPATPFVVQAPCNGQPEQDWTLDGRGALKSKSGVCIAYQAENLKLMQAECGQAVTGWKLVEKTSATIPSTVYEVGNRAGECLDVDSWSHQSGESILHYGCTGNNNQLWAKY